MWPSIHRMPNRTLTTASCVTGAEAPGAESLPGTSQATFPPVASSPCAAPLPGGLSWSTCEACLRGPGAGRCGGGGAAGTACSLAASGPRKSACASSKSPEGLSSRSSLPVEAAAWRREDSCYLEVSC